MGAFPDGSLTVCKRHVKTQTSGWYWCKHIGIMQFTRGQRSEVFTRDRLLSTSENFFIFEHYWCIWNLESMRPILRTSNPSMAIMQKYNSVSDRWRGYRFIKYSAISLVCHVQKGLNQPPGTLSSISLLVATTVHQRWSTKTLYPRPQPPLTLKYKDTIPHPQPPLTLKYKDTIPRPQPPLTQVQRHYTPPTTATHFEGVVAGLVVRIIVRIIVKHLTTEFRIKRTGVGFGLLEME